MKGGFFQIIQSLGNSHYLAESESTFVQNKKYQYCQT